jgi:hypothetical protein
LARRDAESPNCGGARREAGRKHGQGRRALVWALSVPAMPLAFQLYQAGRFDPALWFPYYLLVTLLLHSLGTLYYFKWR